MQRERNIAGSSPTPRSRQRPWPGAEGLKLGLRAVLLLAIGLPALSALARAQAEFNLQPSPSLSSFNIAAALSDRLQAQGSRLMRFVGGHYDPVCDVWWVKSVPAKTPATRPSGVLYGELQTGALVGLLHFISADAEDFRDQKLKPGFYIMRYAQVPPDNDQAGSSQYQDFLLLSPMGADSQVTETLPFNQMARLSALATGTGHPALMSLVPANPAYKRLPAVVADDVGNCALQASVREEPEGGARDVELALLLLTPPKEEGGS